MTFHIVSKVLITIGSICIILGAVLFTDNGNRKKLFFITRVLLVLGVLLVLLSAILPALRLI